MKQNLCKACRDYAYRIWRITFAKKIDMEHGFDIVKDRLNRCDSGFINRHYTVSMVYDLIMEMKDWKEESVFIDGMRALGVFDYSQSEVLSFTLLCETLFWKGLKPISLDEYYIGHPDYDCVKEGIERLLQRGVIRRVGLSSDADRSDRKAYYLPSPQAMILLFRGCTELISVDAMSKETELVVSTSIMKKELFFNSANCMDIDRLYSILDESRFGSIMDRLRAKGRKAAVACLFYGAPGTGKTELVKQLAGRTGRDIVIADFAKLFTSWHGETEKNVKELFECYHYLQCISPKAPILLFNEADGLLGKRIESMRQCVDKIENRIQNMFLQALEDFEGIFIATTNLTGNLDAAFERRFLFKIYFQKPDADTRTSIWRAMIPELKKEEATILGSRYEFTGGQIENVAKKRDIDEALFGEVPSLEKMLDYCDSEVITTGGKSAGRIDFNKLFFGSR